MDVFFIEDSTVKAPTRPGVRSLVAAGGIYVPSESLRDLEDDLDQICIEYEFPEEEEFKWSPGRELWMWAGLRGDDRRGFFRDVLSAAKEREVRAIVVVVDVMATGAILHDDPPLDATFLLLERAQSLLVAKGREALVIADEPSGGASTGKAFVAACARALRRGTDFVQMRRLRLIVSADSKHLRLLQLADLVTGCTAAFISGERNYAPNTFEFVKPLLRRGSHGQIGGSGLKLHPDLRYLNLYHWLIGDKLWIKGNQGVPLPFKGRPYKNGPDSL